MTDLGGYARARATVEYPGGFTDDGVTVTGEDLTGIGQSPSGPERLTAQGSLTVSFPATNAFGLYLLAPWPAEITMTPPSGEGTVGLGCGPVERACFVGLSDAVEFDSLTSSVSA